MSFREVKLIPCGDGINSVCAEEILIIRSAVQPHKVFIDHVGSTAIGGILTKPSIDLLVSTNDWSQAEWLVSALEKYGYSVGSSNPEEARFFLTKPTVSNGCIENINVHLTATGSSWGRNMVIFRDELGANETLAKEYEQLKIRLAADYPSEPDNYTEGKNQFVAQVLNRAAGSFGIDRLLGHQRAELNEAQFYQNLSVLAQFCVAVVAAVSVFSNDNTTQLNFAVLGFFIGAIWFWLAHQRAKHRATGDQARRMVLLTSGLGAHFSAAQRRRVFDQFTVSTEDKPAIREEDYFASRRPPGYARLCELIAESAYWTRDLQRWSAIILQIGLGFALACIIIAVWVSLPTLSTNSNITLARVLVTLLVFLLSSDVIGAAIAHASAAAKITDILQRTETATLRDHPEPDVLLLMSDYNAVVESAPIVLPGIFQLRRKSLARKWRAYLENERV